MFSICVVNQKGGAGKTTSGLTLADALSRTFVGAGKSQRRANVLVVDADPQKTAYKWESRRVQESLPRYPVRVEAVSNLGSVQAWHVEVLGLIEKLGPIDYLVIDTPPNLQSLELSAAMQFADIAIMPFFCHAGNVEALEELVPYVTYIQDERQKNNFAPMEIRVLVNKYTLRRASEVHIFNTVADFSPWPVLETRLKDLVAYADAHTYHTSLYAMGGPKEARVTADKLAQEVIAIAKSKAGETAGQTAEAA